MINQDLDKINYSIDELTKGESEFKYYHKLTLHENFVLYLKAIYNEVPHQYQTAQLIHITEDWFKITLEVDADCNIPMASKIHFVFMRFLEENLPPKIKFSKIKLEWS